jgi:rare lipoprotein A
LAQGWATWYGGHHWHGRRTASGERFDPQALTAAHRTLPLGTRVRVVNLSNGREVWVRINDRVPKGGKIIIDLSETAAEILGMRRAGKARVKLYVGEAAHTPV